MRARRAGLAAVGAVALLLGLVPPATPAAAADDCVRSVSTRASIDRVAGPDRYATAACVSQAEYPDGTARAILARGDVAGGLADALAGAVLAHKVSGPVLLTAPDALPAATADELERLGVSEVTILGGPGAVSAAVEAEVRARGATVDRLAGGDRYATAAQIAQRAGAQGTAFIVNGGRPADSLVAAAPAARAGAALLLVQAGSVPRVTERALDGFREVVIVGGYGVVGDAVEQRLRSLVPRVGRVSGATRSETAASIARAYPAPGRRLLVTQADRHLVDAATAGWAGARRGNGPVLYVERDQPGRAADRYLRLGGLQKEGTGLEASRLVGGETVLSSRLVSVLESRYAEAEAGGRAPQLRGMWIHLFDDTLKSRTSINRMLDAATAANLNTVVVEVVRRQDSYYRSDVLPRTTDGRMPANLDLLAHLVPAAHQRGLQVHAWVPVLPAYHPTYDSTTLPPNHVWRAHGPSSADPWTTRSNTGASSTYLDPGVGAVQNHVAAVMRELAERYPVDAVHLDYLRYESNAWGYHARSLSRFRAQTGFSGTPAPSNASWSTWRRAQTHDLAKRVFLEVASADPQVAVSLAGSTIGAGPSSSGGYQNTMTYSQVFQDWPAWLREGSVDAVFPMNYFRESSHRAWYDDWVRFESGLPRGRRILAVGQGSWLNPTDSSLAQVRRALANTDGVVLYSYQQTTTARDPQALLTRLAGTEFREPAPAPPLPARRSTAGHILARAADGTAVRVTPEAGGEAPPAVRADAAGRAGFLFLDAGVWRVSAPGYRSVSVTVSAGQVRRVTLERA
jgi:uncharacterized lipoprotein YddW (UPF0748 family)/putative cell wall-binding protein